MCAEHQFMWYHHQCDLSVTPKRMAQRVYDHRSAMHCCSMQLLSSMLMPSQTWWPHLCYLPASQHAALWQQSINHGLSLHGPALNFWPPGECLVSSWFFWRHRLSASLKQAHLRRTELVMGGGYGDESHFVDEGSLFPFLFFLPSCLSANLVFRKLTAPVS